MKISVVTVCYNAVDTIEETMRSVLDQTYPDVEYIVIDGSSTDGTVDIIKKYSDRLAYWVSEPDNGIYDAMNKGIKVATGDYINFMNAGDTFVSSDILNNVVNNIDTGVILLICNWYDVTKYGIMERNALDIRYLKRSIICSHQALFISLEYHKKHLYDIRFKFCADYKFVYDAYYKDYSQIKYAPVYVANYIHDEGFSANNIYKLEREKQKIWDGNKLINRIIIEWINCRRFLWCQLSKILPVNIICRYNKYRMSRK